MNGDGKLDILLGDSVTLVSLAKGVSKKEYAEKLKKWNKDYSAVTEAMSKAGSEKERSTAQKRLQEVYQRRSEFMHEERTGYVWLYRQK